MTKTERIYAAVVALVAGSELPRGVRGVHDRKRMGAFVEADCPAIRVLDTGDTVVDRFADYENVNEEGCAIELYLVGDAQIDLAGEIHAEIHRRIWSEPTLSGLAIRPFNVGISTDRDEAGQITIRKTYRYRWRYLVAADDATVTP